jgi:hypothetical protein
MNGAPTPCEMCGAPAEVGPAPPFRPDAKKARPVPHGFICVPCLIGLKVASRTCPPRASADPTVLEDQAKALRNRDDALWKPRRQTLDMVESFREVARDVLRLVGELGGSHSTWLLDVVDPDTAEVFHQLRAGLQYLNRKSLALRDEALKLEWAAGQVRKGIVDFDNPFEDPAFLRKVLAGEEPRENVEPKPQR